MNKMKRIGNQKCENSNETFWQFSHTVVWTISNVIGKVQIEDWRFKRNYVDTTQILTKVLKLYFKKIRAQLTAINLRINFHLLWNRPLDQSRKSDTSGYIWTSGCIWIHTDAFGYIQMHLDTYSCIWIHCFCIVRFPNMYLNFHAKNNPNYNFDF